MTNSERARAVTTKIVNTIQNSRGGGWAIPYGISVLHGQSATDLIPNIITTALDQLRQEVIEECAEVAVRRMCMWTKEDDNESQDFRNGIEKACSDIACFLRGKLKEGKKP